MKYELLWSSAHRNAGEIIEIPRRDLEDVFVKSGKHLGTMTDMLKDRLEVTRGDAARIAEEFFESVSWTHDEIE